MINIMDPVPDAGCLMPDGVIKVSGVPPEADSGFRATNLGIANPGIWEFRD